MAIPLIAAGAAARAIASKLATRAIGGITGAGAKNVAPINRNMNTGSVTKIPQVTKFQQNSINSIRTSSTKDAKSGKTAKRLADTREQAEIGKPRIIKINSNTRAR